MKTKQLLLILAGVYCANTAFATQGAPAEAKQQAALKACVTQATKRYGSVSKNSEPKKKKIGKIRGHAYRLTVGDRSKHVNCIANAKGKAMFYGGQI